MTANIFFVLVFVRDARTLQGEIPERGPDRLLAIVIFGLLRTRTQAQK
jgi:hypothetical protein